LQKRARLRRSVLWTLLQKKQKGPQKTKKERARRTKKERGGGVAGRSVHGGKLQKRRRVLHLRRGKLTDGGVTLNCTSVVLKIAGVN
jgi:hypothetical protein